MTKKYLEVSSLPKGISLLASFSLFAPELSATFLDLRKEENLFYERHI